MLHRRTSPRFLTVRVAPSLLAVTLLFASATTLAQASANPTSDAALSDLATDVTPAPAPIPNVPKATPQPQVSPDAEATADIPAATKNEAPSSSSLDEQATVPLLFAPSDNKISLTSPQLKWDLAKGHHIDFGGISHDSNDITMRGIREKSGDWTIAFNWPQALTKLGQLQILGEQGDIIFQHQVQVSELRAWKAEGASHKTILDFHGINTKQITALNGTEPFRFCLTESRSKEETVRICSPFYKVDESEPTAAILTVVPQTVAATVLIDGHDVGTRGIVNYDGEKTISASVRFENGATIDFASKPLKLNMLDVTWDGKKATDGSRGIIFTGQGPRPLGKVRALEKTPTSLWAETSLGYEPTWQIRISENLPLLRVVGAWNIPFTFVVVFQDLPRDRDRVYIDKRTRKDTYASAPRIHGVKKTKMEVYSKQQSVSSETNDTFVWSFNAPDKGAFNRSRLLVKNPEDKTSWYAHYRFYRGYQFETSARISGIVTQDAKAIPVGELAASYWAENLGFDNYTGDRERWGITARYFRALSTIDAKTDDPDQPLESIQLSSFNIDLKYNIQAGLWNRDQLYGAILSYEGISLNENHGAFLGLGGYWARSMPKFLDDFFNNLPFLRYPKYLDIELVLYPMAISSGTTPQAIYNLNFHSKVFWTRQLFGELGVGIKSFGFKTSGDSAINNIELNTLFGTIGVGAIF